MERTKQEQKETLLREAEAIIDELLAWEEAHTQPTLSEMEDVILQLRQKLGRRMAELALQAHTARRPAPGPICPCCGAEMQYKGEKAKRIDTLLGEVELERAYYTCAHCGQRAFPPGSATCPPGPAVE